MVLQQCLACNTVLTDTCTSCVCGHVFEYTKQIGGKRFSEYRVELYTRLENKRMRKLAREKRKEENSKQTQPLNVNKSDRKETSEVITPSTKPRRHSPKSTTINRRMKSKRFHSRPTCTDSSLKRVALPPELVSRLPSALQEINRRLTGQNLMWWKMHLLQ